MEFIKAIDEKQVRENSLTTKEIGGKAIVFTKVGGVCLAFDQACTHAQCRLEEGFLEGLVVECPCHGGRFNIRTGEVLSQPPVKPLPVYQTKVEEGWVWVEI